MPGHGASDGGVQHGGVLGELSVVVTVVEDFEVCEGDVGRLRLALQLLCLGPGLLEDVLGEGGLEGGEAVIKGPQDSAESVVLQLAAEIENIEGIYYWTY